MSRRKDGRYHGTLPDPRYLQRIQEHNGSYGEDDGAYEPVELQPLRPRVDNRPQTRSFNPNESHPIEEKYSVVQPVPRFLSRMQSQEEPVDSVKPEFQIQSLSRDNPNEYFNPDEYTIHNPVYLPQIHAREDEIEVDPNCQSRSEISSLSYRVETNPAAQARKPSLIRHDEISVQPRDLLPPSLGLSEPGWEDLIAFYLIDSEAEDDDQDEDKRDVKEIHLKRARKLPHIAYPLAYRRLELKRINRLANLKGKSLKETAVKSSRLSKAFKIWKEQWDRGSAFSIWDSQIKAIEGRFGSGIGSYFRFLRFLILFYLSITVTSFVFVVTPQILTRFDDVDSLNSNVNFTAAPFAFQDLFTAGGWMAETELLYGTYGSCNTAIFNTTSYSMPEAYFYTTSVIYVFWAIILAITMAKAYRRNFIDGQSLTSASKDFSFKLFTGWDFAIIGEKATKRKQRAMTVDLEEMLQKLEIFKNQGKRKSEQVHVTIFLWTMRFAIWIFVAGILVGIGFAIYFSLEKIQDYEKEKDFMEKMSVSAIATLVVLVLPIIFSFLSKLSSYGNSALDSTDSDLSTRLSMYATLFKTLLLELVVLGVITFYYLEHIAKVKDGKTKIDCWENGMGQEMYRFLIVFLFGIVFISFLKDLLQNLLHSQFPVIPLSMFDIASETTHLIYGQTITWLGLYFSPLLPFIFVIILVITFYMKMLNLYLSLRLSQDPSKVFKPWRAAQSKTVFLVSTFTAVVIASLGIVYTVTSVKPSDTCGPFIYKNHAYDVIGNSDWFVFYPTVVVGLNVVILVTLYYIYSMGIARHNEVKTYRKRLKQNKKENNLINEAVNIFREMRDRRVPRRKSSQLKGFSRNPSSVADTGSSRHVSRNTSSVADSLIADMSRRHSSMADPGGLKRKTRSFVK